MKTVYLITDDRITRRKAFHFVCNPEGDTLWYGQRCRDMFEFLLREGVTQAILPLGETELILTLATRPSQKGLN